MFYKKSKKKTKDEKTKHLLTLFQILQVGFFQLVITLKRRSCCIFNTYITKR